jgi:DinB superfamily
MINEPTLTALAAFPRQLEQFYDAIPIEYRNWTPPSWEGVPSETFTAIEQICHVRDVELDGYHVRFQRMLREKIPTLESLDGHELARERHYSEANDAEVFAAFRGGRAETLQLLSSLTPEQCDLTAVFEGYGTLTVRSLAHYLCSHDQQHLAGMQWLLGQIDAARVRV